MQLMMYRDRIKHDLLFISIHPSLLTEIKCAYVHECMCYMYVYMYACLCLYACMCTYVYCTYIHAHVCTYVRSTLYRCTYVNHSFLLLCIYVCMYMYIRMYTQHFSLLYIYTYLYIICTYMCTCTVCTHSTSLSCTSIHICTYYVHTCVHVLYVHIAFLSAVHRYSHNEQSISSRQKENVGDESNVHK